MATAPRAVAAAFAPSGRWLAVAHAGGPSGSEPSRVVLWNVPVARVYDEIAVNYEPSTCATFGSERRFYVGLVVHEMDAGRGVLAWVDIRAGTVLERQSVAADFALRDLAVSADGRVAVVSNREGLVWIHRSGAAPTIAPVWLSTGEPAQSLAIRPDGRVLALSTSRSEIQLWTLPDR